MAVTTRKNSALPKQAPLPTIGRGSTNPKKSQLGAKGNKTPAKPNASILSFFKKTDEDQLFVADLYGGAGGSRAKAKSVLRRARSDEVEEEDAATAVLGRGENGLSTGDGGDGEVSRFNEDQGAVKRRKLDTESGSEMGDNPEAPVSVAGEAAASVAASAVPACPKKPAGPFMEDSDSESDGDDVPSMPGKAKQISHVPGSSSSPSETIQAEPFPAKHQDGPVNIKPDPASQVDIKQPTATPLPRPPALTHQATSMSLAAVTDAGDDDDDDQFRDIEGMQADFDDDDDVYDQGEEFVERQYMEEQRRLELEAAALEDDSFQEDETATATAATATAAAQQGEAASCPICSISLHGVSDTDASTHVNNCLDGNPTPLPPAPAPPPPQSRTKKAATPATDAPSISDGAARFKRPPRSPKPGQQDPFATGPTTSGKSSAFSKLMSSHAEDAAWAAASAAENASRGKPAYTRTCPFYKIMPGLNICVDAFRYGAVKGCNAYFLSHFHSDHYIGLTSTWTHGPIYCSRVTANLVRQQLRVDPQYVIPLDWETPVEVPGTTGTIVTMIAANHCPGSSLYLFEKAHPGSTPQKPKLHRILHCGDFRACPAHLEHPLLMPDIVDQITKKSRQQKIDVCYLDTTYLNPKYAFPSQTEVIRACADMCVSLNRVSPDDTDGWETMKRARAGQGMVKFIRQNSSTTATAAADPSTSTIIKQEEEDEAYSKADLKLMSNGKLGNAKQRARLLVVVGTYSIGKERICLGIAKALKSLIYAPPQKMRIVRCLDDEPELQSLMTTNPRDAQVHMTPLFEIRADTLDEYLVQYADSFGRCVGFRPSGWQYRPPGSRFVESPSVSTVLYSPSWKSSFSMKELVPQRGSTGRAACFGVPYSEHSSFRELSMFCSALRIDKVVPTVNVGSVKGRERMKVWIERWEAERRKNGLFKLGSNGAEW